MIPVEKNTFMATNRNTSSESLTCLTWELTLRLVQGCLALLEKNKWISQFTTHHFLWLSVTPKNELNKGKVLYGLTYFPWISAGNWCLSCQIMSLLFLTLLYSARILKKKPMVATFRAKCQSHRETLNRKGWKQRLWICRHWKQPDSRMHWMCGCLKNDNLIWYISWWLLSPDPAVALMQVQPDSQGRRCAISPLSKDDSECRSHLFASNVACFE